MLVASLVLWLINKHLCASQYWLAIFHAIYHIFIADALWNAGTMGIFFVQEIPIALYHTPMAHFF